MTKAACHLILHCATISLIWRSVKELQRHFDSTLAVVTTEMKDDELTQKSQGEQSPSTSISKSPTTPSQESSKKDVIESSVDIDMDVMEMDMEMDMEILQLWALFALHKLYANSGIEYYISFIVPFYFYVKMIILLVTVIPSTKFPSFWFETVLVPMMNKFHELLDLDWRGLIMAEAVMLPWRILDLTIFPGLMLSEEEAQGVKRLRTEQLELAFGGKLPEKRTRERKKKESFVLKDCPPPAKMLDRSVSDVTAYNRNTISRSRRSDTTSSISNTRSPATKTSTRLRSGSRGRNVTASSTSSPSSSTKRNLNRRKERERTKKNTSLTSPVARSRVAASGMHLRKFSRQHQDSLSSSMHGSNRSLGSSGGRSSSPTKRARKKTMAKESGGRRPQTKSSRVRSSNGNDKSKPGSTKETREKRRKEEDEPIEDVSDEETTNDTENTTRTSLGGRVRTFITGDSKIRLRDYFFDVNLPTLPSPRKHANNDDDSQTVSTNVSGSELLRGWDKADPPPKSIDNQSSVRRFKRNGSARNAVEKDRRKRTTAGTFQRNDASARAKVARSKPEKKKELEQKSNVTLRRSRRIASSVSSRNER